MVNNSKTERPRAASTSDSEQDDGDDGCADDQALFVSEGEDEWVFVKQAAGGEQPHATEPEDHERHNDPQALGVVVEHDHLAAADVVGKDHDRGESAGCAEAAQLVEIGEQVAATVAGGGAARDQVFKLGKALDDGQRKKQED